MEIGKASLFIDGVKIGEGDKVTLRIEDRIASEPARKCPTCSSDMWLHASMFQPPYVQSHMWTCRRAHRFKAIYSASDPFDPPGIGAPIP